MGSSVFLQGGVYLTRAEDDSIDFFVGGDGIVGVGRVWNDPLEMRFAYEVFDGRAGDRMAEKRFGEEKDQSFPSMLAKQSQVSGV